MDLQANIARGNTDEHSLDDHSYTSGSDVEAFPNLGGDATGTDAVAKEDKVGLRSRRGGAGSSELKKKARWRKVTEALSRKFQMSPELAYLFKVCSRA